MPAIRSKSDTTDPTQFTRRGLLRNMAAGAAVLGAAGCRTDGPTTQGRQGRSADLALPNHIPYEGVPTEFPATEAGGLAAFMGYPRPPIDALSETPGSGGNVSVMYGTEIPVPAALSSNVYWQNLNSVLGVELDIQAIPVGDYTAKRSTVLAGGELTDIMQMPITRQAQLPGLLEAKCADLTEYLAGDAIADYPMLAVRTPAQWRNAVFNDKIFGVPTPNGRVTGYVVARRDILDRKGLSDQVTSADDFAEFSRAVTDPRSGTYVDSNPAQTFTYFISEMFGVPNRWRREDDGSFTSEYVTEEFKAALEYTANLWREGVFHPDSFALKNPARIQDWVAGRTVLFTWGGVGWENPLAQNGSDGLDFSFIHPPMASGGGMAGKFLGSGVYQMGVIRKESSPERIRELLRVMNYIAAAQGTAEYLDVNFGVEGTDYEWEPAGGDLWWPVRTDQGLAERATLEYLSGPPYVIAPSGHPEIAERCYTFMSAAAEGGVDNPTDGLYSDTANTDGVSAGTELNAVRNDIIAGRASLGTWDEAVARWRSAAGDRMSEEYAAAWTDMHG